VTSPKTPTGPAVTPKAAGPRRFSSGPLFRFLSAYGLPLLMIGLFILFSLLLPSTFPTQYNIRAMLSNQSIIAFLALAEMVPIATNSFDLSVGYGVGLYHILALGLIVNQGLPWPLVIVIVLLFGATVGLIDGVIVTRVGIDPFIASLGVGTILYGIAIWYAPFQIVGQLPSQFIALSGNPGGIPLPFVYVVILSIALWIMFERLPLGRYLYMLGSNPRAAELTGISAKRYIPFAFVLSGVITAFAGIILGSQLEVASTAVGPDYLLPSFVGALLGSTAIRPGRVNVIGTLVAVFVLAIAVAGLQQLGAQFFVQPLFNGFMLIGAVGLASVAARRRARIRAAMDAAALG
jgi:ribose transport system permease protein